MNKLILAILFAAMNAMAAHPVVEIVQARGMRGVFKETVAKYIGSKAARDALVKRLGQDPSDDQEWRNDLQALALVSSGDHQLALATEKELEQFAVNTLRFGSKKQACYKADPCIARVNNVSRAGALAKAGVPECLRDLYRLTKEWPDVQIPIRNFLVKGKSGSFWQDNAKWTSTEYVNVEYRIETLTFWSIMAALEIGIPVDTFE